MSIHRITVSIIAVVLAILLYNLPRVVVDNDSTETGVGSSESQATSHDFEMTPEDSIRIANWSNKIAIAGNNKKSTIFADSLANLYLAYNKLDSAEKYAVYILAQGDQPENHLMAGDIFFKAYGFSKEQSQMKKYGEQAASSFNKVLESDPDNPDVRAKLAMTKVTSANPMEGIMMLRKVLEEYPENETALYNLGILSMQSGQYDKAVDRFSKLIELYPGNVQALFYLAVSLKEVNQVDKAAELFEKVKEMDDDPAIQQAADGYLKEINEL